MLVAERDVDMADEPEPDERNDVPPWWDENVEIKEELGLPGYDAPKFDDGVYVHAVVDELESRYGCQIQFIDPSPTEESRWEVRVDGQPVEEVQRTRDADSNTVFRITSAEFRAAVEDADVTTDD